jgi:hypothetical protein
MTHKEERPDQDTRDPMDLLLKDVYTYRQNLIKVPLPPKPLKPQQVRAERILQLRSRSFNLGAIAAGFLCAFFLHNLAVQSTPWLFEIVGKDSITQFGTNTQVLTEHITHRSLELWGQRSVEQ